MALQEKLDAMREVSKTRIPPETRAVMERSIDDLRAIYLKFGIDLARGNGDGTWRLPVPARFVIDRHGIIRAVDADPDYTRRSEPAQTVEILEKLRPS